jgi:hypothetical protein
VQDLQNLPSEVIVMEKLKWLARKDSLLDKLSSSTAGFQESAQ